MLAQQFPGERSGEIPPSGLVSGVSPQDQYEPVYLGRFSQTIHEVGGDIFILDDKTIYIQVSIVKIM